MTPPFGSLQTPPRKRDDTVKRKWGAYKEGSPIELHGVSRVIGRSNQELMKATGIDIVTGKPLLGAGTQD